MLVSFVCDKAYCFPSSTSPYRRTNQSVRRTTLPARRIPCTLSIAAKVSKKVFVSGEQDFSLPIKHWRRRELYKPLHVLLQKSYDPAYACSHLFVRFSHTRLAADYPTYSFGSGLSHILVRLWTIPHTRADVDYPTYSCGCRLSHILVRM